MNYSFNKAIYHCFSGIHQDEESHAEESPDKTRIFQAIRKKLHDNNREPHHTIYEVKMRTSNASKDLEGVYQCGIERQYDKLFVISSVAVKGNISPFPQLPKADLVSCENTNYDPLNEHISLSPDRPTCVRCKGFGYPPPSVGIYNYKDQEVHLSRSSRGSVTKYINVADAGISEATYTWINPSQHMFQTSKDYYTCRATNDFGSRNVRFRILLR